MRGIQHRIWRRMVCLALSIAAIMAVEAAVYTPRGVPDTHRADRRQFVSNPDGILSAQAVDRLNTVMGGMRERLTVEPMVVAVDDIDDPSYANEFATDLFELWGMGKSDKDNGLLVLIVKNRNEIVIRTGYGLEGALPDISCGRIIREVFAPAARSGDLDGAIVASMDIIDNILLDPATAEEYRSAAEDADEHDLTGDEAFELYLMLAVIMAIVMLVVLGWRAFAVRGRSDYDKYKALAPMKHIYLVLTVAGLFIPVVAAIPLVIMLNRWRNRPRVCPHCRTVMEKVDEVRDNDYLTPSQDLEERIGSVDYDVWLCPKCGETDVLAYVLPTSTYIECDNCHARTMRPTGYRVVTQPTADREGVALKEYECLNCHHRKHDKIDLPRTQSGAVAGAIAAASILGGRRGGFGGGGFGGGFGGGHTGGGGASGRW